MVSFLCGQSIPGHKMCPGISWICTVAILWKKKLFFSYQVSVANGFLVSDRSLSPLPFHGAGILSGPLLWRACVCAVSLSEFASVMLHLSCCVWKTLFSPSFSPFFHYNNLSPCSSMWIHLHEGRDWIKITHLGLSFMKITHLRLSLSDSAHCPVVGSFIYYYLLNDQVSIMWV